MKVSSNARRYLAFDYDLGGWNNIVMHFEIMVVLAWLTRRTLVLPPAKPLYLLGEEPHSLTAFFDLHTLRRHLEVIEAAEFAAECADWESFRMYMGARGHAPGWNAVEDALLHPSNALTARLELIPRLFARRPVGITPEMESCEILYFPATHEHRMFGVFESFFLFADPANERRARGLVRDALHYRPEILALVDLALARPPLAGESYSAMHVRRGDFQYAPTRIAPEQILRHTANIISEGATLYLATDETDPAFLRPFEERFRLVRFTGLPEDVTSRTPYHWQGIVETLLCAAAPGRFVGTRLSTFSSRIATVRGHLSCGPGPHADSDTALYYTQPPIEQPRPEELLPYDPPRRKHEDQHGETSTPWWKSVAREPIWSRAYQATWVDTANGEVGSQDAETP
ncbi:MAG: hypothetical protein ABL971_13805 [Vicinamibacterales bacterium]